MWTILSQARAVGVTDVHLTRGGWMSQRRLGRLEKIGACEVSAFDAFLSELYDIAGVCSETQDFAFADPSTGRLRVHGYRSCGEACLAIRLLPAEIPAADALLIPEAIQQLVRLPYGLVIISGPTGSGKSTTLASLLAERVREAPLHIMTIESPIEYILPQDQAAHVHQIAVPEDVPSFAQGVVDAMRADPDIVMIGEMRDRETMQAAITLAETGHLVFTSLHTGSAVDALYRLVDAFPAEQQGQIRRQLAALLRAVVCQRLCPTADSQGLLAVFEVLINTPAVAHLIRENTVEQILSQMQTGRGHGMRVLEEQLSLAVKQGQITRATALAMANDATRLLRY